VLIDVLEPVLRATEKEFIETFGENRVYSIVGDLSKKEVCKQVIDDVIAKFGKLDVLYINHGIMPSNTIELLPNETFEKVMAVNFMSFVYLAKCAIPHLRASKGSYGVTSSMAGKIALINLAPYVSSKHALNGFFDVLRIEEKQHGVSVTIVCPGGMKTELAVGGDTSKADDSKSFIKLHLPEDLAPGIVNAVAARKRDHYTDRILRTMGTARALFPQFIDNVIGPLSKETAGRS
jgi:NAD(P)-dependent dehydrogenase (short-subunit alcohol dehydrogenase family)